MHPREARASERSERDETPQRGKHNNEIIRRGDGKTGRGGEGRWRKGRRMLEQLWGLLFGLGGGGEGAERREADPDAATHPPPSQNIIFSVPEKRSPFLKNREGVSHSMRKAEISSGRDTGVPPPPLRFAQPKGEAPPGSAENAALAAAANAAAAAAAAARAPSRRVHGVSPGGCSGSPGTAPSSARPPRSAPAPPPPWPAHRRRRRRRPRRTRPQLTAGRRPLLLGPRQGPSPGRCAGGPAPPDTSPSPPKINHQK